jgi:hypothetical protein
MKRHMQNVTIITTTTVPLTRLRHVANLCCVSALLLTANTVDAQTIGLPAAPGPTQWGGTVFAGALLGNTFFQDNVSITGPGDFSASEPGSFANFMGTGGVDPSLSFSAIGLFAGGSTAELQYSFVISGPAEFVGIEVSAAGTVTGLPSGAGVGGGAESIFNVGANGSANYLIADSITSGSFTENSVYSFATNTVYDVTLGVGAGSQDGTLYSASIDPTFQIASSVTDPQDYRIQFSPGIGPLPVPDNGMTVSLLGIAFTGLTMCWRRFVK